MEKEIGTDSVQYATVLNNMAGICRLMGHFDDARRLFHMAEQIYARAGEEQSYAYASVLNNMSLVYRELEDLQPAIDYLEKAREIFAQALGEDDARTCAVADDLRRLKEGAGA